MQENTMRNLVPKASRTPFFLSFFLLALIVIASIAIFIMDKSTMSRIVETESLIAKKSSEISEIKKDRRIIITNILTSGTVRPSLDLRGMVNNFRDAADRSTVRLKGFSIANDVISTELIATQADPLGHSDPAGTIIAMMRTYDASGGVGSFDLKPINTISGDQKSRATSIQFKVIPTK